MRPICPCGFPNGCDLWNFKKKSSFCKLVLRSGKFSEGFCFPGSCSSSGGGNLEAMLTKSFCVKFWNTVSWQKISEQMLQFVATSTMQSVTFTKTMMTKLWDSWMSEKIIFCIFLAKKTKEKAWTSATAGMPFSQELWQFFRAKMENTFSPCQFSKTVCHLSGFHNHKMQHGDGWLRWLSPHRKSSNSRGWSMSEISRVWVAWWLPCNFVLYWLFPLTNISK